MSTGDSTDSKEAHCMVTVSILMDNIDVQLYHKALPFVSTVQYLATVHYRLLLILENW